MPDFCPNSIILYVADVDLSTAFYSRILGRGPQETFEGLAVFALSRAVTLCLQEAAAIEPAADDVDRIYARWRELGVPMMLEPTELDFGYTFVAVDPDGHRLRVCATDTSGLS